jgi:tetratricopeptide (TPR) repeat protein
MLAHRLATLVLAAFAVTGSHPTTPVVPPAARDTCTTAADSILDFDGDDSSAWSGLASYGAVRRLTRAASAREAAYTPDCFLDAAETLARAALAQDSGSVARHYALAVVLGLRADREGGRTKVRAASDLYEQLTAILQMDPGHVGAHHMLGRLQAGVMRMNAATRWIATRLLGGAALRGANWADAEHNLAFAVAAAPDIPDYHYELAHLYEDTGRPELALQQARRVLAMGPSTAIEDNVDAKAEALVRRLSAR